MKNITISIDEALLGHFPSGKVGVLFVSNCSKINPKEPSYLLQQYSESISGNTQRLENRYFRAWLNAFQRLGITDKDILPANYSLTKQAIKHSISATLPPLVSLYNYLSLKYMMPIGGHSAESIDQFEIGFTKGNETFQPINSSEIQQVDMGEPAYIAPALNKVLTRFLTWRQGTTSQINNSTSDFIITFDDFPNLFTNQTIENIAKECAHIIHALGGGEFKFAILDSSRRSVSSNSLTSISIPKNTPHCLIKRMDVITDEQQINEVLTKGVKEIFPDKEVLKTLMLSGKRLKLYTGIDPTADFIHMGHMIWMKKLSQFQKLGHEVIFLIGGFTAMIGDPDKKNSRMVLTKEQVEANFQNYRNDASKLIDFDWEPNPVQILNNYDWLSKQTLESWLDVMSNVTMQHILSHDMFRQRIETEAPIRLHEIMYPLMQGYDGVHMEVDLEVGGSDQTFNMLTGRILSRNMMGKEKYVMTLKLLTDNSGNKMGKTTNNSISFKDTPADVYGKIMSISDEVLPLAYELLSDISLKELTKLPAQIAKDPMGAKKELALEITQLVHSQDAARQAQQLFEKTVQNDLPPEDIKQIKLSEIKKFLPITLVDLLVRIGMVESKGQAKRMIIQGAVEINLSKATIPEMSLDNIEPNTVIRVGKRNWIKLV